MSDLSGSTNSVIETFNLVASALFVVAALITTALLFLYGTAKCEGPSRSGSYLLGGFVGLAAVLQLGCLILEYMGMRVLSAQVSMLAGGMMLLLALLMIPLYKVCPDLRKHRRLELHAEALESQNAQLKKSVELAQAQVQLRRDMTANISHELRSPLSAVIGFQELLLNSKLGEEQHLLAKGASDSALVMLSLLNDLQDLIRIEDGAIKFEMLPFDPAQLVKEACAECAEMARYKKLFMNTDVDPNMPTPLFADGERLQKIIVYLISNALKHTSQGGIVVRVGAESIDATNATIRFWIQDTGMPLSEEEQAQLFEPLRDVLSGGKRRLGQYGLRLYLARRLIEMMGGTIQVQSNTAQGCIFTFSVSAALERSAITAP